MINENKIIRNAAINEIEIEQYAINDFGQSAPILLDLVTPSVTVTSLNNGEVFEPGDVATITWEASDAISLADTPITIWGSINGIQLNFPLIIDEYGIPTSMDNTGEFSFTIPSYWYEEDFTIFLLVVADDTYGNRGYDATNQPIIIDYINEIQKLFK